MAWSFKSRRGGEVLNKVLYGKAPPEAQPLTLLNTIFDRKGTYFVHLRILLKSGTPFRVLNFASLLSAVSRLSLKYEEIIKSKRFLDFFHGHIMHLLALLGLYIGNASTGLIPTLSIT